MVCDSKEGNLFHEFRELLLLFFFFDAIRKPGGLFFISVGQLQQRPIDERKVEFKKGTETQNILSSFLLQIKRKNIEEELRSLL